MNNAGSPKSQEQRWHGFTRMVATSGTWIHTPPQETEGMGWIWLGFLFSSLPCRLWGPPLPATTKKKHTSSQFYFFPLFCRSASLSISPFLFVSLSSLLQAVGNVTKGLLANGFLSQLLVVGLGIGEDEGLQAVRWRSRLLKGGRSNLGKSGQVVVWWCCDQARLVKGDEEVADFCCSATARGRMKERPSDRDDRVRRFYSIKEKVGV